jgi:hypothetical protein
MLKERLMLRAQSTKAAYDTFETSGWVPAICAMRFHCSAINK